MNPNDKPRTAAQQKKWEENQKKKKMRKAKMKVETVKSPVSTGIKRVADKEQISKIELSKNTIGFPSVQKNSPTIQEKKKLAEMKRRLDSKFLAGASTKSAVNRKDQLLQAKGKLSVSSQKSKRRANWRITDGKKYPVIISKLEDLDDGQ
jgi:hypothetical protein